MTLIRNATVQQTSASTLATDMIAIGKVTGTNSISMTLAELQTYIGTINDKIIEGDSKVEVVDTGTGKVEFTIDGDLIFTISGSPTSSILEPANTGTFDLGKATNQINDIHMSGGIELGSDAQGDIYFRDGSGKLVRLGASTAGFILTTNGAGANPTWAAASSGSGDSRWVTWTGAIRTADGVITSTTNLAIGTPVRFKATADSVYEYAIITNLSTNAHTIVGHSCTITLDDDFEYGVPELIHTETIMVNGSFADGGTTAATYGGLLYDDLLMKLHMIWNKADAYLVQMQTVCMTSDNTTDPTIIVTKSTDNTTFTNIYAAEDVDGTLHSNANEVVTGKYEILFGNNIEFTIAGGGTGDAKDLSIILTFILE